MFKIDKLLNRLAFRFGLIIQKNQKSIARATLPKFKNKPAELIIELPRRIVNPHRITIGDNVYIGPGSLLMAVEEYNGVVPDSGGDYALRQKFEPEIIIGDSFTSTGSLQISALEKIVIEADVMFASNIFISDGLHGYQNARVPYRYQRMEQIAPVTIKRGSWIGQNVVILPGVTIGEFVIIGANSVVNQNIPDRSIAVGSPARVIKKWSKQTNGWDPVSG
jgi:acetyltransferase-like isoleucine patch superfamily enzyme